MSKDIFIDPYYSESELEVIEKLNKLELNKWYKLEKSPNREEIMYLTKSQVALGAFFEFNEEKDEVRRIPETEGIRTIKFKKGQATIPWCHNGKVYKEPLPRHQRVFKGNKLIAIESI